MRSCALSVKSQVIPRHELMNIVSVTQLEKDTILVCYDNMVKVVNLQGKLKSSKRQASELHFDFSINCIVCLTDSVLAFHRQGMQGRSFKNNEVTYHSFTLYLKLSYSTEKC